jgi:hypothetical protein
MLFGSNRIELWWKPLRSLTLKELRFEILDELTWALNADFDYWNAHFNP